MIFLTGSTGLIGSFIAKSLINEGYKVRALKRPGSDLGLLDDFKDKIEWVDGCLTDVTFLNEAVQGVHTIVHSAAVVSYSSKDKEKIFKINVEGTANLVNAAIQNKVSTFCHVSSVAALGKKKGQKTVDEESALDEPENISNYGRSKYLAELEVFRGREEGLNVFMINPSVVLGPGDWNKGSSKIFKYVYDKSYFYSYGKLNYIDVRDVADIVCRLLAIKSQIGGEKFILNAGCANYKEVFWKIADNFKVKRPPLKASPFLAEVAWRAEALKSFFSTKDPLITKETVKVSKRNYYYESEKIKNLLKFDFRDLDDTLKWTCSAFLERQKAPESSN